MLEKASNNLKPAMVKNLEINLLSLTHLLPILCRAASNAALSHTGGFRVGGGVHDSYTFQCGLVGYFTSPGIDTR